MVLLRQSGWLGALGWGGAESADPGGLTLQPSRMGIWTWEKDRPRSGLKTAASSSPDMVPLGSNAPPP